MIISIDGPIGSGKTTLTSLLASTMDGIDFKHTPADFKVKETSVTALIGTLFETRTALRDMFNSDGYATNYRGRSMLLFNLLRCLLIRSNTEARESEKVFIDTFWDPFWTFEREHYDKFYPVICTLLPAPDISFFLRVDESDALRRAEARDPLTEHVDITEEVKEKRRVFLTWARDNIPNFYELQADLPVSQVFEQASTIIKEHDG